MQRRRKHINPTAGLEGIRAYAYAFCFIFNLWLILYSSYYKTETWTINTVHLARR